MPRAWGRAGPAKHGAAYLRSRFPCNCCLRATAALCKQGTVRLPNITTIREDRPMHRPRLVGAAIGLFASVAIASTPAMATPCTDLQTLALENTTITSATDNTTGEFVV